jgi:WD40 repeat protein
MQRGKLLSWPARPLEWFGHQGGVNCISYSPNGCYAVTASDDSTIRIWDAETGDAIGTPLEGHTDMVLVSCLLSRWAAHHLWIK